MEIFQTDSVTGDKLRTIVTIDRAAGTTRMQQDTSADGVTWTTGTPVSYTGKTNGVVYCDGNIGSQGTPKTGGLSGTVANHVMSGGVVSVNSSLNIVTPPNKNVNISGGIVYANLVSDASDPENVRSTAGGAATDSGILGLVSGRVQVVDKTPSGADLTDVSVHATVMAYDTFDATNPSTRPAGSFKLLGGYIVKSSASFGVTDAATGTMINGFSLTRNYDSRTMTNPPPYYPVTSNQYLVLSYRRSATALAP
jgi:hypothetical protein